MQASRSHDPIVPDVTAGQAPASKADAPAPGASGWKAPSGCSPNPGCPSWQAPSSLVANPGSPTWEAPSKVTADPGAVGPGAVDPGDVEKTAPSNPASPGQSHAPASSSHARGVVLAAVALLALVVIMFVGGTASLKSKLESRTWSRHEDSLRLELDFDGDEIDYSAHSLFFSSTIASMDYIVVSPSGMMVAFGDNWRYISVDIDDGVMRLSPAITDVSDEEYWF